MLAWLASLRSKVLGTFRVFTPRASLAGSLCPGLQIFRACGPFERRGQRGFVRKALKRKVETAAGFYPPDSSSNCLCYYFLTDAAAGARVGAARGRALARQTAAPFTGRGRFAVVFDYGGQGFFDIARSELRE
jgi:hypothetical protein